MKEGKRMSGFNGFGFDDFALVLVLFVLLTIVACACD
ncbi:sporulation protein YjcZ [Brevibacillus nitrificans]|nr:sporulation protein YjcZ [Brevibacillus centrosporus]RNB89198.1 sporulation protein YjcZ [Brevibacillus nitrificans]